jgi:Aspartyl protease/PDZ domain
MRYDLTAIILATILAPGTASAAPDPQAIPAAQVDEVLVQAHTAAGGTQLDGYAAMSESGAFSQNGSPPNAYEAIVDLRNGYSRGQLTVGPATMLEGYNGTQWTLRNGSLTIVSLPSFVADAVTQAYLSSNAYFRRDQQSTIQSGREESVDGQPGYVVHVQPRGGSPADLYFDASSYRLVKIVAQTAQGTDTTTNSNFQTIQGVTVPMRSVDVDATGTQTVTTVKSVQFSASIAAGQLARPAYTSQGNLESPVSIPFVSDQTGGIGHIVVPVGLNGQQASLVFDSGGGNFLVPDGAKRLGLAASGGVATGGAGTKSQMSAFAHVDTVDFGGARLSDQNFVVTPLGYPLTHPRKGVMMEGLIGFEYLANFRVSVRYADDKIDVAPFDEPAPTGGVTLPFKSDGSHAYVLATLDNVTGYYLLDTGNAGGIVLTAPFVKEHRLFPKGGLLYRSPGGVGGGFDEIRATAQTFAFAGQLYHDVPIDIPQVTAGFFATRGVAGNLGSEFLARFTVVFDYKAQTVTFIPNRNAAMAFHSDRIGWSLTQNDFSGFDVRQVIPGSPAANAGIEVGDRISAFAGNQVATGFGSGDLVPYTRGTAPFTVSFDRGGVSRTVTLTPRYLLPPPQ